MAGVPSLIAFDRHATLTTKGLLLREDLPSARTVLESCTVKEEEVSAAAPLRLVRIAKKKKIRGKS
jgi:hypothetical protein